MKKSKLDTNYENSERRSNLTGGIRRSSKNRGNQIEKDKANTRFFHLSTIVHKRQNAIYYIQTAGNSWMSIRLSIVESFINYYTTIFTADNMNWPVDFGGFIPANISIEDNETLMFIPTKEEVRYVVFSMKIGEKPRTR